LPAGVRHALGLDRRTTKTFIALFDLRRLLDVLVPSLRPLRHPRHAVPVLAAAAIFIIFMHSHVIADDLRRLELDRSLLAQLIIVFVCVRTVTTLASAAIAHRGKAVVRTVGVAMVFGFLPRWAVKVSGARTMPRSQIMWLHGAALLSRLFMFAVGMLLWWGVRDANDWWSQLGLVLSLACGMGLLLDSGSPLVKTHGYHLLAAFLDEPRLRDKAFASWANKLTGKARDDKIGSSNALALYGLVSLTYVLLLVLVTGWALARFLLGSVAPNGAAIGIGIGLAGVMVFMIWRSVAGLRAFAHAYKRHSLDDHWRSGSLAVEATGASTHTTLGPTTLAPTTLAPTTLAPSTLVPTTLTPTAPYTPATRGSAYGKLALALALVLLPMLLLPYTYEPSGRFVVSSARRAGFGSTSVAMAQIDIIESDIEHVKVGAEVRARASTSLDDEFVGKVTHIDSKLTARPFGNVIRVAATFDNQDERLVIGMTGQAKIEATDMPAWKASSLAIARFVRLHLWSWMP
jgi:hypothetical protein